MTTKEFYEKIGEDYEAVLTRLGTDKMVHHFALKFLQDPSFNNLKEAVSADDGFTAFRAVHTLKGVTQNLGFAKLGEAASKLTEYLRADKQLAGSEVLYAAVQEQYNKVVDALKELALN